MAKKSKDTTNDKIPTQKGVIMPDEVRPALADMKPDPSMQEESGQDAFEDETASGHVIRPAG